jgi:serine/threonine protein kinase
MSVTDESSGSLNRQTDLPSSHESEDAGRIQQWIDCSEWDVFEAKFPPNDDIHICQRALETGFILPFRNALVPGGQNDDAEVGRPGNSETGEAASDRYRQPRILGVGGYGVVFAAEDSRLGIPVALKFLRPSHCHSLEFRSRFLAEAKLAASLSHPGIIRIYDIGRIDNLLFITSARSEAGSLARWVLREKQVFEPRQAAWMVHELAEAVSYSHSLGMLHRDLKPANVLLEPCPATESEGLGYRPILTDFGLAKRIENSPEQINWSSDGQAIGTTRYMSPEQAAGQGNQVSSVSDVFALGIILYELAVGKVPFDGPTPHAIRQAIIDGHMHRPRVVRPKVPADLEAIILKSLSTAPVGRYQTMREFRLDLRRFLNGEPIEAQKSTFVRRTGYWIRKHPVMAFVAATTIALNVAALLGLGYAVNAANRALAIEQSATQQVQSALSSERTTFERYLASEESRVQVLRDVVTLYSDVTDDIIAGKKVGIAEMIPSLEKTAMALADFLRENPRDSQSLHRLNVIQHYLSIGYNSQNQPEKAIESRQEAIRLIERLLEQQPDNHQYRFDRFMSYLILGELQTGERLQSKQEFSPARQSLAVARTEIEDLCRLNPDNLGHLEGRLEVKRLLSEDKLAMDPPERIQLQKEIIDEATTLAVRFPTRESFGGIAISTGMELARQYLAVGEVERAEEVGRQAIHLFDQIRRPIPDEISQLTHALKTLVAWYEVLDSIGDLEEAVKVAAEANTINTQVLQYQSHGAYYKTNLSIYLFRMRTLHKLGRKTEAEQVFLATIEFVRSSNRNATVYQELIERLEVWTVDQIYATEAQACLAALKGKTE